MAADSTPTETPPPPARRSRRWQALVRATWPHWPLAIALAVSGLFNILNGLRVQAITLGTSPTLATLGDSLAVLGRRTQIGLGIGLVLVGIGLLRRLRTAWVFAVLLLAITMGINIIRAQRGLSLLLPALMLLALLAFGRHFRRISTLGNYLISLAGILAILAFGTFGSYLLGQGFRPPIADLTSAFYYTIITLSTVGYGDIVPISHETRLFVTALLIVGVSVFATAIASTLLPALTGELSRIFNPGGRVMESKDHVILVGEGPIARNTALELAGRGIPIVQVVPVDAEPPLPESPVLHGDASDDAILRQAGIARARMVIAARAEDGENAFIALVAKDLNPQVRVLAVASSARSIRLLKLARADLVFAPAAVGSRLLADLVEGGQISQEFRDLLEGQLHRPGG